MFAKDPFRFTRMHLDVKHLDLYIFREYNSLKTRNEVVFHELYDELQLVKREEQVIADSAEQKSIADFKAYGAFIRGAIKGPESVRYGIKWLQGLNHIYIDKRKCPYTFFEFSTYEYEQDREGNFISQYPDANNHCLSADTLVHTVDGKIRIEDLVGTSGKIYAYDIEKSRVVVADYINCRQTFESAEIWEVELEDGQIIECTYDHPILTSSRGYVKACELTVAIVTDFVVTVVGDLRVKSVHRTDKKQPVYDIEVPKYHNFVIANGIVVHNSIDSVRYALEKYTNRKGT